VSLQDAQLLVIGYGNELRRDDGVGPKVAALVAEWKLPGVRTLVCHQLTPELADPIASVELVVFVDACVGEADAVQVHDIEPSADPQILAHAADPRSLLALAKQTYGHCPAASWVSIPAQDLDFGDELSPLAQEGIRVALGKLRQIADAILR
jgi:hydrogenase maturation protease